MNENSLGYLIRHYRELKGLSKSEFARRVGVSYRTIVYWENNTKHPTIEKYGKIAEILGVNIVEFSQYFN